MIKEQERQFFALKSSEPHRVSMGGKRVALASFPKDIQKQMLDRIAEKDEIQRQGQLGILPGLKIDGKQVTKDNIHEFEIGKMVEKPLVKVIEPKIEEKKVEVKSAKVKTKKAKGGK